MQNLITKFWQSSYFGENRLLVWKIENFVELELP